MEGWGAVLHKPPAGNAFKLEGGIPENMKSSVPARGLFMPDEAEPRSINQRELLAAILGLKSFLEVARNQQLLLVSDSQVSLAVTRNWTSKSPRILALLRILRRLCEDHGISLALRYIPSVLNTWADKLSRHRDASDWCLTASAAAQVRSITPYPLMTQLYARRDTVIPGIQRFHSPAGTGIDDPAGIPLPTLTGEVAMSADLGYVLATPTPAQVGLLINHLLRAPSDAVVVVPDWPAQPWYHPALQGATATYPVRGPTWQRARHNEDRPYIEISAWTGRILVFNRRTPDGFTKLATPLA
jgi:hypothetical protein